MTKAKSPAVRFAGTRVVVGAATVAGFLGLWGGIAAALGVTIDAVKGRQARALVELRRHMSRE